MKLTAAFFAFLAFSTLPSLAADTLTTEVLPPKQRTNGGEPSLALKDRLEKGRLVTVRFQEGRRNKAFGTIVDASGLIVAKLSDVAEIPKLQAVMSDGSRLPCVIQARDTGTDLALLKVESPDPLPFVVLTTARARRKWALFSMRSTRPGPTCGSASSLRFPARSKSPAESWAS